MCGSLLEVLQIRAMLDCYLLSSIQVLSLYLAQVMHLVLGPPAVGSDFGHIVSYISVLTPSKFTTPSVSSSLVYTPPHTFAASP